jgi:hypothetical protein
VIQANQVRKWNKEAGEGTYKSEVTHQPTYDEIKNIENGKAYKVL